MRLLNCRRCAAGLPPLFMGIVNVTPDSFSDGGRWAEPAQAAAHAAQLSADGADLLDVGGESTRPGAAPVPVEEELRRVLPAVKAMRDIGLPISVDTMKASTAEAALVAGADIINDVSGLGDPMMATIAARYGAPLVIMHMYGTPATFRTDFIQGDALQIICDFLTARAQDALAAGVHSDRLIMDPGLGFGTTHAQAVAIMQDCARFSLGGRYPVLAGPSRKRFLAAAYPGLDPDAATAQAALTAWRSGADILRVHDVKTSRLIVDPQRPAVP